MGRNYQGKHQGYTENRGGYQGDGGGRRYNHNQHDDRDDVGGGGGRGAGNRVWTRGGTVHNRLGPRTVNFEMDRPRGGGISKRGRGKYPNKNIHIVLPDDDLDMDRRSEQAGRARPPSYRGRGSRGDRGRMRYTGGPGRGITVGESSGVFSWHKVVLKNGTKYDKIVLLKELLARTETKFIPICYSKQGVNTQFYLEDGAAARALKDLDKKLEMPDGFPLAITVDRTSPPNMPISDELVEKIKVVMSKRYFVANKALNLSAFHVDEDFAGESFYAPLWRTNIMNRVLMVIQDNIPEVAALDLSNNKLNSTSLDFFTTFKTKVPDLRILHLANNKMNDTRGLEKMKGLPLVELKLTGNPLIDKLGSSYKEVIRKIFPKLEKLDDKELPKTVAFDCDEDEGSKGTGLPPIVQKMIRNEEAGVIVCKFLEEYFKAYDSDSRQPLLDAYHEEAVMSMSAHGNHEKMPAYIPESRNLKRVYEKKAHDLLRRGKLQIVAFLSKLPKTEHDLSTFTLDVPFTSPSLMTFTVTGLFRERDTRLKDCIRHFNRCFIVVPQGGGFCIINETLFISTATDLSTRRAFASPPPTAAGPSSAPAPALDAAAQQAMAVKFSEQSGMNIEWSGKCLVENSWNFEAAARIFAEAKAAGKIPPEAFVK